MSATYQRDLRKNKMESYEAAITNKNTQLQQNCMTMHHTNEQYVEKLVSSADPLLYPQSHECNLDLGKLAMKTFSKCLLTMLKYFIYVCVFNDAGVRVNPSFKWPKIKGNLILILEGEYTMISLTYKGLI